MTPGLFAAKTVVPTAEAASRARQKSVRMGIERGARRAGTSQLLTTSADGQMPSGRSCCGVKAVQPSQPAQRNAGQGVQELRGASASGSHASGDALHAESQQVADGRVGLATIRRWGRGTTLHELDLN